MIFIILLLFVVIVFYLSKPKSKHKRKKSDIGKIFKTKQGYFYNNTDDKKNRFVIAVEQRKDDGALGICPVESKKGKESKISKNFVDGLVLSPSKYGCFKEDSIVKAHTEFGRRSKEYPKKLPIFKNDLIDINCRLTNLDMLKVHEQKGGKTFQHRRTFRKTRRAWRNHFSKKK